MYQQQDSGTLYVPAGETNGLMDHYSGSQTFESQNPFTRLKYRGGQNVFVDMS